MKRTRKSMTSLEVHGFGRARTELQRNLAHENTARNQMLLFSFILVNGFAKGKALSFAFGSFKEWINCPLGVCRALPLSMKKMRKNTVFEYFLPCKLRKEPINRRILGLFAAKFYKSDRLLARAAGQLFAATQLSLFFFS